jgi:uroporphyrinogen-III synthase
MTEHPLAGLNIVVTRPREQAANLMQRIEGLGGKPLAFPLLEITPASDARALHELARHLTSYDLLIFISPNAVRYGMSVLHAIPGAVRVAAVGQSSAQALRNLGIPRVIAPVDRFDSEALLALPELQNVSGWRIAILRGDGGRELLGDTLKARGAQIEYVTCYQRGKPALDTDSLLKSQPDIFTVTSSEALAHLWETVGESSKPGFVAIPLLVPHARIAEAARLQGWQHVIISESGDDGLIASLVAWAHAKGKQSHE